MRYDHLGIESPGTPTAFEAEETTADYLVAWLRNLSTAVFLLILLGGALLQPV